MKDRHPEQMHLAGIYAMVNRQNGKRYVGSTRRSFDYRKYGHLRLLRKGEHHSPALQAAWNKYGEDAFVFVVLECVVDLCHLLEREQHYIDERAEYNAASTAGRGPGLSRGGKGRTSGSSFYKGVHWSQEKKMWRIQIVGPDNRPHYAGYHKDEIEAALVADKLVRELFPGEDYANFPLPGQVPNTVQREKLSYYLTSTGGVSLLPQVTGQ